MHTIAMSPETMNVSAALSAVGSAVGPGKATPEGGFAALMQEVGVGLKSAVVSQGTPEQAKSAVVEGKGEAQESKEWVGAQESLGSQESLGAQGSDGPQGSTKPGVGAGVGCCKQAVAEVVGKASPGVSGVAGAQGKLAQPVKSMQGVKAGGAVKSAVAKGRSGVERGAASGVGGESSTTAAGTGEGTVARVELVGGDASVAPKPVGVAGVHRVMEGEGGVAVVSPAVAAAVPEFVEVEKSVGGVAATVEPEAPKPMVAAVAAGSGAVASAGAVVEAKVGVASLSVGKSMGSASAPVRDGAAELALRSYEAPSSNQLEVGLSGGSMGWLKVRAEMSGTGEVHAYLRGGTADAAGVLQAQSGAMQTYLSGQDVKVAAVHVESARLGAGRPDAGFSSGAGSGSPGSSSSSQQGASQGRGRKAIGLEGWQGEGLPVAMLGQSLAGTGGWLSVRV